MGQCSRRTRPIRQGTVERLTFSREEYEAFARHEAEEAGRDFDPQTLEGPYEEILLRGTGALIQKAMPGSR